MIAASGHRDDGVVEREECADSIDNETLPSEHPSVKQEKNSIRDAIKEDGFRSSRSVANILVFAFVEMWIFAVQFRPEAFTCGSDSFGDFVLFWELSFLFDIAAVGFALLCRHWSARRWAHIGDMSAIVAFLVVAVRFGLVEAGVLPSSSHGVLAVLSYATTGFAMGMAFCNWARLYVRLVRDIAFQIGLSLIIASIGCIAIVALPVVAVSAISAIMPLVVVAMLWHMRWVEGKHPTFSMDIVMEGGESVRCNAKLWVGICFVGFAYGVISGYAVNDAQSMWTVSYMCPVGFVMIGAGISMYCVATGRNPGYSLSPVVFASVVCCGYAIFAVFHEQLLSVSYLAIYCGYVLFDCVLLMQLPRVYRKMTSLNTFFALYLVFMLAQFLGLALRHFLFLGTAQPPDSIIVKTVTSLLLCGGIVVISYMCSGNAVSTAWDLIPFPVEQIPRRRYGTACARIRQDFGLTPREEEIMFMVGRGRNGTYVQEKLVISKSTYQTHMRNLYKKLDIHSNQELIDMIEDELGKDVGQDNA